MKSKSMAAVLALLAVLACSSCAVTPKPRDPVEKPEASAVEFPMQEELSKEKTESTSVLPSADLPPSGAGEKQKKDEQESSKTEPVRKTEPEKQEAKEEKETNFAEPEKSSKDTPVEKPSKETPAEKPLEQPEQVSVAPPAEPSPECPSVVFDVADWVAFGKEYAQKLGLKLSNGATGCWDNPITASAENVTYLERDLKARLNLYAETEGVTSVWIWAEKNPWIADEYLLFVGYA